LYNVNSETDKSDTNIFLLCTIKLTFNLVNKQLSPKMKNNTN